VRIFIGLYNIANLMDIYSNGFRRLGFQVDCFEVSDHPFYDLKTRKVNLYTSASQVMNSYLENSSGVKLPPPHRDDRLLDMLEHLMRDFLQYDIYIFMNCMSLLPGNLDYPILKRNGKIIISLFSGSEIRHSRSAADIWSAMDNDLPDVMSSPDDVTYTHDQMEGYKIAHRNIYERSIDKKIQNVCMAELFADVTLSVPEQSGLQLKPYQAYVHAVDSYNIKPIIHGRKYPIVTHLPSNPAVKRSDLILRALDELSREGVKFTLIAKSGIPHLEVMRLLSESDILIDQISNFPALLSHEGMASGCAVLTGCHPLSMPIPLEEVGCPAVHITIKTLKEQIRNIIKDREERCRVSKQGVEYIAELCTPQMAAERLIDALERASRAEYDYFPMWHHAHIFEVFKAVTPYSRGLIIESIKKNGQPSRTPFTAESPEWSYPIHHLGGWTYCRALKPLKPHPPHKP